MLRIAATHADPAADLLPHQLRTIQRTDRVRLAGQQVAEVGQIPDGHDHDAAVILSGQYAAIDVHGVRRVVVRFQASRKLFG